MLGLDIADATGQQASSAEAVTTDEYDSGSWTGDDGTEGGRLFLHTTRCNPPNPAIPGADPALSLQHVACRHTAHANLDCTGWTTQVTI